MYEQMVAADEMLENEATKVYLLRLIGEEGLKLLETYPDGTEFSDEELAEKTEISLNNIRQTLYILYSKRLAKYRRIKNPETGWLTYLWTLQPQNLNLSISEDMEDVLDKLELRVRYEEENDFYICNTCGLRYTFDEALSRNFECNNCDVKIEHFDNELLTSGLKKRVAAMKEALGKP